MCLSRRNTSWPVHTCTKRLYVSFTLRLKMNTAWLMPKFRLDYLSCKYCKKHKNGQNWTCDRSWSWIQTDQFWWRWLTGKINQKTVQYFFKLQRVTCISLFLHIKTLLKFTSSLNSSRMKSPFMRLTKWKFYEV